MENNDKNLIEVALQGNNNPRLVSLYSNHRQLNTEVERLANQKFLTSQEEVRLKNLKKKKLATLEEMIVIARSAVV